MVDLVNQESHSSQKYNELDMEGFELQKRVRKVF